MAGEGINRTTIDLPAEVSEEILQKVQEQSVIMQLAPETELSGRGEEIPVILGDPEAEWVNETENKAVSKPNLTTKLIKPYTLAVIVPFSNQFRRDAAKLYDELVRRLPGALGYKFDGTVFGNHAAPGENFDTFSGCTSVNIGGDNTYDGLVTADIDIAEHDGILNGYVISPKARGVLLSAKDGNQRPLFINSVAEGAIPMILGARTLQSKAAYKAGSGATPNVVGVAGDWNMCRWGAVEGVQISIADQATLTYEEDGATKTLNLFQRNMFAVRAEIEVGFRAETSVFNLLTTPAV